jgi:hypothetical protein
MFSYIRSSRLPGWRFSASNLRYGDGPLRVGCIQARLQCANERLTETLFFDVWADGIARMMATTLKFEGNQRRNDTRKF